MAKPLWWFDSGLDSVYLMKDVSRHKSHRFAAKSFSVRVRQGPNGIFKVNYDLTFQQNGQIVFKPLDSAIQEFNAGRKAFEILCDAFSYFDIKNLRTQYKTESSEPWFLDLEIKMIDGQVFKSEIENLSCPDELRLALIRFDTRITSFYI